MFRLRGRLDEEDSNWLASQHALARAYEADRQVKKAVEPLEHVVALREQLLATPHLQLIFDNGDAQILVLRHGCAL